MAEKQIKTRIKLLTRTLADWNGDHKDDILLAGEIGICEIPSGKAPTAGSVDAPTVLFKVGDGQHPFQQLNWASALAADVYSWAKCSSVELDGEILKFHNGDKEHPVHTVDLSKFALDADLGDVSTLTTTAKTAVGAINEHDVEIGDLSQLNTTNKNNLVVAINEALQAVEVGGTGSVVTLVKEDKGTSDEYTLKQGGEAVGDKIIVGKNSLTMKAGGGLSATETTFSSNDTNAPTFEVSHADTSNAQNLTADGRKYVTGLTFDDYGHVTGYTTGEETNQTIGDGTLTLKAGSNTKTFSANSNDDVTFEIKASDLGLDTAIRFIGTSSVAIKDGDTTNPIRLEGAAGADPTTVVNGDVVFYGDKEFIFVNGKWEEFGYEGDYALKSITITGEDGLKGGGDLTQNRVIKHAIPTTDNPTDHKGTGERTYITNVKTDKFGHVVGFETGTETDDGILSVGAFGDEEVSLDAVEENGAVTITAAHTTHAAGSAKTASAATIAGYDGTGTINIPKIVTNAAGHVTEIDEETVTITMPPRQEIPEASGSATIASVSNDDIVTLKAGAVLSADHTLANDAGADITLAKIAKTGSIYDVVEASKTEDDVVYLLLDCNWES